jgi:type I restriction enzyme, S subunit
VSAGIQLVRLADVALLNPRLTDELLADTLISFVPMSAVSAETARVEVTTDRAYSEVSKGYTSFESGDVLFAKITPCFENGKIAQAVLPRQYGFGSTEFHVIRSIKGKLDARYLHHFLRQDRVRVAGEKRMTGSGGQRRVPTNFLSELEIPLPLLPEQRRIAAILDQAETLRTQRRTALALLDTLTQSIFLDMLGDKANCPRKPLASVCDLITDGTHYTPTYAETGVVFLSAKNVTSGRIDWERIKYIPQDLHIELQRRVSPKKGDVLMAKNGTTGVAAIVDRDCVFDIYVSLALLRPSAEILTIFLHAALNSPASKKQFNAHLKGIGVPNLHLKDIRQTLIPVPSIALQQTFATRIQAIEALKSIHRTALAQLDALFASLQHRAFSGTL